MDTVKIVEFIETTLERRGDGKSSSSPVRVIKQYWSKSGERVFEIDPCAVAITPEKRKEMYEALVHRLGENAQSKRAWDAIVSVMP